MFKLPDYPETKKIIITEDIVSGKEIYEFKQKKLKKAV